MKRRDILKAAAGVPLLGAVRWRPFVPAPASAASAGANLIRRARVRPGDPGWPSAAAWQQLKHKVGGRLLVPRSPFAGCAADPRDAACAEAIKYVKNPFYIGDQPGLTQTSGWLDAWTSQPSAYAVAARDAADVAAAVDFAREHNVRLVVKGGGHSYQGRSDAPDSLLVWTRHMNAITLHDAFVGQGCAGKVAPQPAVSVGAGAIWIDVYNAVTTRGGRYVQGGGCTTVGVAGLVQSGGFGSFSKRYGTVAAGLLEAEVVTADGQVRIANACSHPDLFWALKGGGGGSLGVVTRLTLRTRELPDTFGAVLGTVRADSDASWKALIAKALAFYRGALFNPHWGEQMQFNEDRSLDIRMVFQGLDQARVERLWAPFLEWVRARKAYIVADPFKILAMPARHFWDADFFRAHVPGAQIPDDRPGAPKDHVLWAGDQGQVGWFIHGYQSAWLPESLLRKSHRARLADAIFQCTRYKGVELHFNKGLAGAPKPEIDGARDTATHPDVLDAFALAIIADGGAPAYPGLPGADPDRPRAHRDAEAIDKAMRELTRVAPDAGAYFSESNYFQRRWQRAFWGRNHARLAKVKRTYDPHGLFFVHHGVGSEAWSVDGFTPR